MRVTRQSAFTLIELMVVLTVLAILLGMGVPAMGELTQRNRQAAEMNQMLGLISYARTSAALKGRQVVLCNGESSCLDQRIWQGQMQVFEDADRDRQLGNGETPLKVADIAPGHNWYWSSFPANRRQLTFRPDGLTDEQNGTFVLCRGQEPLQKVVVNKAGRPYIVAPESTDRCK